MPKLSEELCKNYWDGKWRLKFEGLIKKNVFQIYAIISPAMTDTERRDGEIYCELWFIKRAVVAVRACVFNTHKLHTDVCLNVLAISRGRSAGTFSKLGN